MRGDPIIRGPKEYKEGQHTYRIMAYGGLHYIKGNRAPYFSLTGDVDCQRGTQWQHESSGSIQDEVLRHWSELAPIAALHLSYIDGEPMHAEGNGWYFLAGALGGMGQRYHAGNGDVAKSEAECLATFAEHCRIPLAEAQALATEVKLTLGPPMEDGPSEYRKSDYERARKVWGQHCEAMRPRWKREAEEAIATFGLKVYGDPWEPQS